MFYHQNQNNNKNNNVKKDDELNGNQNKLKYKKNVKISADDRDNSSNCCCSFILIILLFIFFFGERIEKKLKVVNIEAYDFPQTIPVEQDNLKVARAYFSFGYFNLAYIYFDKLSSETKLKKDTNPNNNRNRILFTRVFYVDNFSDDDYQRYEICRIFHQDHGSDSYRYYLSQTKNKPKLLIKDYLKLKEYLSEDGSFLKAEPNTESISSNDMIAKNNDKVQKKILNIKVPNLNEDTALKNYIYEIGNFCTTATAIKNYVDAARMFKFIGNHLDAPLRYKECLKMLSKEEREEVEKQKICISNL